MCAHLGAGTHKGQKTLSDLLELELQAAESSDPLKEQQVP